MRENRTMQGTLTAAPQDVVARGARVPQTPLAPRAVHYDAVGVHPLESWCGLRTCTLGPPTPDRMLKTVEKTTLGIAATMLQAREAVR